MTYEDVLKWFQLRYKLSKSETFKHYTKVVMDVLEKQIPKKPTYEGDGYDENGNLIYDTWICPCCEEYYEVDYDNYEHCPKCGQAIDRSNAE